MTLKFELIATSERLQALENDWNTLLPTNATNEIFLTWQWQTTWWGTYEPGDLWVVTARDPSERLVGIAPWFRETGTSVIRPIGGPFVTDYHDVLVLPEYRERFLAGIVDQLHAHRDSYSGVSLCNHQTGSPTLELLPRLLQERGFGVNIQVQAVCPVVSLPGDFEGYLSSLDAKQRHEARRKIRRAEAEVDWYVVGSEHDLAEEVDAFVELMASSSPRKARFLQNPKHDKFFRAIAHRLAAHGWLQLAFLTVMGERAAAYLNFDYKNRILVYNSGLLPEKFGHLSPGNVLLLRLIELAAQQGRSEFDFLRGGEDYKYRLGGKDRTLYEIQVNK